MLGRFNLYEIADGAAVLGYRVAEHAGGRGLATVGVVAVCGRAADRHGLRVLRAATSDRNAASRRVLEKAGFTPAGPADPADLGGNAGSWWERDLRTPGARGGG